MRRMCKNVVVIFIKAVSQNVGGWPQQHHMCGLWDLSNVQHGCPILTYDAQSSFTDRQQRKKAARALCIRLLLRDKLIYLRCIKPVRLQLCVSAQFVFHTTDFGKISNQNLNFALPSEFYSIRISRKQPSLYQVYRAVSLRMLQSLRQLNCEQVFWYSKFITVS